jgi:heme A synthase
MDRMSEPALISHALGSASRTASARSPGRLRGLAVAATATTFALIGIGALVRATGSGLGCTGWPKCTATSWLPPLRFHSLVEYSHRFTAFLDVVLAGALAMVAWRGYRDVPTVFVPAVASAGLVVFQAVLGGIVVHGDLEALLVTAHLVTAMLFAAVLVVATVGAYSLEVRLPRAWTAVDRLAAGTAGAALALIGVGAYVRGEGAGLAFTDWPLMGGRVVPATWSVPASLQFTHRVLAAVVLGLVAWLAVRIRGGMPGSAAAVLSSVAAGLVVAQVLVGAANVWSRLASAAVVAHVTLAGLAWGAIVATVVALRLHPEPARARSTA